MSGKGTCHSVSFRFGAYSRAIEYGQPCGDAYYFHSTHRGLLFTLIDGLGHGSKAQHAAVETVRCIKAYSRLPLEEMVRKTHIDIRSTRGCVAFIGRISLPSLTMECVNIGNISCRLYTDGEAHPISRPGILGHNMKKIHVNRLDLDPGDRLVLCTDGVSTHFDLSDLESDDPEDQAREVVNNFSHSHDDASALIIHVG